MGYIAEPKGVDFIVGPTILTAADAHAIRQAIKAYKKKSGKHTSQSHVSSTSIDITVSVKASPVRAYNDRARKTKT